MSRDARIVVVVTVKDGATADELAEQVLNLLASDPDDVCPLIETVDDVEAEVGA